MNFDTTLSFAKDMDAKDSLNSFKSKFHIPKHGNKDCIYFCGNSLGLQPQSTIQYIEKELTHWKTFGVEGHFKGEKPWMNYHHFFPKKIAPLVGALESEVVVMNNLTANLHLMMVSFYQPNPQKYKIVMEAGAFPSDQYAVESQVKFHGFDPKDAIIEISPKDGNSHLETDDIVKVLEQHKGEVALVMFSGVQYYTGQVFDIKKITEKAHQIGSYAGFDLAHATGNVKLELHDWKVDFAVWCSYKYLNSGPGGTSGVFVHQIHESNSNLPRFAGWWGHNEQERFLMKKGFIPMKGAAGWQLSNAQILPMAAHLASLDIFEEATFEKLLTKSKSLFDYTYFLISTFNQEQNDIQIKILTPREAHGCQLSLVVNTKGKELFTFLTENGVISDWREPDVIRIAPVPLYNTFEDSFRFYTLLHEFIEK